MFCQELNENWTLSVLGDNVYHIGPDPLPVTVPGSVYSGLLERGLMPDPYWRDNERDALQLMENDFLFCAHFEADPGILASERIVLRFEGIDTIADISLNGKALGHADNMHRAWEYDVTGFVRTPEQGGNELRVRIFSPTRFLAQANEHCYTGGTPDAMPGFSQLRKAHCMFGWDWGPRLPDAGIYRPVKLLGFKWVRLSDDILITQEHKVTSRSALGDEVGNVKLTVRAGTDPAFLMIDGVGDYVPCAAPAPREKTSAPAASPAAGVPSGEVSGAKVRNLSGIPGTHIECELTSPEGGSRYFGADGTIVIRKPKLWWPNGYGEQPLYTVTVRLFDDETGEELDRAVRRIGLRTLTVDTSPYPDEQRDPHLGPQDQRDRKEGRHFHFVVNGLPIFAMGADYIPEDNILQRVTPERTRRLLTDARDAHHNCIRVWGGGYYPDDFFYDLCDELGLVVWQDFMFACANYELTEDFEENITAEFVDVIRRLRHHASLGLWCGNNEMETQTQTGDWQPTRKQVYDYIKLYEYILPKIVKREDPQRFYWPSSPSSGGNYEDSNEENRGDAHYWGVWHGGESFPAYRRHHFRFLSEFGFQSFPCAATVETFTEPEDRNVFSEIMQMHQRNTAANGKIMNYLSSMYRYPKDFDSVLYCSQLLQLDAIRCGVEHFRRIRGTCMGTIVWQLNDIWPVASWSSIDYYGRWKALHYGEKRFFAPVSITCMEHGRLDQKPYVNTLPVPVEYSATLHVANETGQRVRGVVNWQLRTPDSRVLRSESREVAVPPYSGIWLDKRDFTGTADEREMHLYYEFVCGGKVVSRGSTLFVAPQLYRFADPQLTLSVSARTITVHAQSYAKGVCIKSPDGNLRLTDNFFDMEKGERTVEILGDIPEGEYTARSVYDISE